VARFHYRHEAELAHGYLEDAGVPTAVFIDDAGRMDVGLAFVNPARVVVRLEDEQRAREVLADVGMLADGRDDAEADSEGDFQADLREDVSEGS
jgi:hypothetical protein